MATMLLFLWYPLLTESRLGRIARARRKIIAIVPAIETTARKILFLPAENDFLALNREVTAVVRQQLAAFTRDLSEIKSVSRVELISTAGDMDY